MIITDELCSLNYIMDGYRHVCKMNKDAGDITHVLIHENFRRKLISEHNRFSRFGGSGSVGIGRMTFNGLNVIFSDDIPENEMIFAKKYKE